MNFPFGPYLEVLEYLRHYPTCMRYTFHNCNDFVPANIRRH